MSNRLVDSTSPYLLQHADNPVDWFPWGDEAFDEARERDVPVFLSVGYSSCHWCHVMAHESFEDDQVAAYLNEHFVSIKVDREERPDVDAIYMEATTAITGHGGWPMSVFCDHERRPFHAGTYWPNPPRGGMPGFLTILEAIVEAWLTQRDELTESAGNVASAIADRLAGSHATDAPLDATTGERAAELLVTRAWDRSLGGFGRAPKFPQAMTMEFLLDHHLRTGNPDALEAVVHTLDRMARGGIHDQLAGGFHRYSVDARWLVPHFEKMAYDNALLLASYAKAAAITGRDDLRRVATSTADYLLGDLRHPDGGFFSATDADSEGVEGRFFVWTDEEFRSVLTGARLDADRWAEFFDVTPAGNWEGVTILNEPVHRDEFCRHRGLDLVAFEAERAEVVEALLAVRDRRVPPGLDDKVLTSWNALVVRGLARAGRWLDEPGWIDEAARTAVFLADSLVVDGALHHAWKDGVASVPALLEDVAFLSGALLDLYEPTGDVRWFEWAMALADDALERFADPAGGFWSAPAETTGLYVRPRDTWDNATPAGGSVLAETFARLAAFTGDHAWDERARTTVASFGDDLDQRAPAHGYALQVAERLAADGREIAIVGAVGAERQALVAVAARPRVGTVLAIADGPAVVPPLLEHRTELDGRPAAYVCRGFVCDRPVATPDELAALLT